MERILINVEHPETEPDIFLAPQIASVVKPHQICGIRFLYDSIIESLEKFDLSAGSGCILAHSMGLGKTIQIVSFSDVFLRYTKSKTILCVVPVNTIKNWEAEWKMWLPEGNKSNELILSNFRLFNLNDFSTIQRTKIIVEWAAMGGVLLLSYELFRLLLNGNDADTRESLLQSDLLVCDEGHRIKNPHSRLSVALNEIRTKRRILLTGSPIQNHLLEYWNMVQFVRPNFLGTKSQFMDLFVKPIQNGESKGATPDNIKFMKQRCFVLHFLLSPFVQRKSEDILKMEVPEKHEYVLLLRMSSVQEKLLIAMHDSFENLNVLKTFIISTKFWNHPDILYDLLHRHDEIGSKDGCEMSFDWAVPVLANYKPNLIENSPKMQILMYILEESVKMEDKVIVFSQSLSMLNLVQKFLGSYSIKSENDFSFYRLDGSTPAVERERMINDFNCSPKVKLFLISTKAGGIGINLVAANRVIIVDVSWNPCNDIQAISRVYRYHQKKRSYVYRLIMDSCLEENIYNKQLNKQGMSKRVIDDQNPFLNYYFKEKALGILESSICKETFSDIIIENVVQKFSELLTRPPLKHDIFLASDDENQLSLHDKQLGLSAYILEKEAKYK